MKHFLYGVRLWSGLRRVIIQGFEISKVCLSRRDRTEDYPESPRRGRSVNYYIEFGGDVVSSVFPD